MDLEGANALPWPRGFRIGATLDALLTFLKSGGFRGTLRRFKEGQGTGRRPGNGIYHLLGSQGFQNGRIHGEGIHKTKLSFVPLFLMHGSLYHDISEIQMAKYTNTKYLFFCINMINNVYRKVKKCLKLDLSADK